MQKDIMFLVIVAVAASALCGDGEAAVYKVGDSVGWTVLNTPNYTTWAVSKKFHIGDVLVFEYNKQYHNVMEVTMNDYKNCKVSSPIVTYTTGNDSITLNHDGHYYFLCGIPGHCANGQKVDIRIPKSSAAPPHAPAAASHAPGAAASHAPAAASHAPGAAAFHAPAAASHAPAAAASHAPAAASVSSPTPSTIASNGTSPAPSPPSGNTPRAIVHDALALVVALVAVSAGFIMH